MENPIVSVIMALYNNADCIDRSISSVLDQTLDAWELLVVDDGSTDDGPERVKRHCQQDSRIRLLRIEHSGGPSLPRNTGLRQAKGKYIAFLDADDQYYPTRLEKAVATLEGRSGADVEIVVNDYTLELENRTIRSMYQYRRLEKGGLFPTQQTSPSVVVTGRNALYRFSVLDFCPIHTSAITFHRNLLEETLPWFPENLQNGEDTHLFLRLMFGRAVALIREPLSAYWRRTGSISWNGYAMVLGAWKRYAELNRFIERSLEKSDFERYRKKLASLLFALGYAAREEGLYRVALCSLLRSLAYRPSRDCLLRLGKTLGLLCLLLVKDRRMVLEKWKAQGYVCRHDLVLRSGLND